MSRGWESKDVESQIEAHESRRRERLQAIPALEPSDMEARRESLALTRRRVERDLASARHPRRQVQLRAALAFLDAEMAKLT